MNIKYIRNIILMSAFGAVLTGCDTTEDAYHLGDLSDIKIQTDPASLVELGADGTAVEIKVTSNVYWDVEKMDVSGSEGTWLKVSTSSDKGDGTITVSADPNINTTGSTPEGKIIISTRGFDKRYEIKVIQANLMFSMDTDKNFPVIQENGGSVELTFSSSIAWKFDVLDGQLDWFENQDDFSGEGRYQNNRKMEAVWEPNYSQSEREVELQLVPVDADFWAKYIGSNMPASFVLKQEAGTLPEIVGVAGVGTPTRTDAVVRVSYTSKAPVSEVGVTLNGRTQKIAATVLDGGFPLEGSVEIPLTDLTAGTSYEVRPYVVSRVGEKVGDMTVTVKTEDPEYINKPAEIINVQVVPDYKMVTAVIEVDSPDCELVGGGFAIYSASDPDYQIVKYTNPLSGKGRRTFEVNSVDFLQQNTDYLLEPFVIYNNPQAAINEVELKGRKISFTTLRRIPEEDDNKPIE